MRRSFSPDENLQNLILQLRKISSQEKSHLWRRVAEDLSRPSRQRREVNLSRINQHTKENDVVVVPGKVLSAGEIQHKIKIAAFGFSKTALVKIAGVKGTAMSIQELCKSNPKVKGVKIIG